MPSAWQRIWGLVRQEFYVTRRRMEIIMDILFFPLMNVVLFGYITTYIGTSGKVDGTYFILGVLLWEVMAIVQYNVSVSTMWSVWSHNLTNIFITPISTIEYLLAQVIAAVLRTLAVVGLLSLGTYLAFGFNILQLGALNLLLFLFNLTLFSCWLGILVLGFVFRFGLRVQSITWYIIFIFQPLTAAFFPLAILPGWLQAIARLLPPTYVFEAARTALTSPGVNRRYALTALSLNILYCSLALVLFSYLFRRSKQIGQFARNDL